MNKSPKTVFSLLIPAVIFVAAGAAIFAFQNFSNKRVLSGFAGYVYSKPIFGQNRFVPCLNVCDMLLLTHI